MNMTGKSILNKHPHPHPRMLKLKICIRIRIRGCAKSDIRPIPNINYNMYETTELYSVYVVELLSHFLDLLKRVLSLIFLDTIRPILFTVYNYI